MFRLMIPKKKSIFLYFLQFLVQPPEQLRQVSVRRGEGGAGLHQVRDQQHQQQQGGRDPAGEPQQAVDPGWSFFSKKHHLWLGTLFRTEEGNMDTVCLKTLRASTVGGHRELKKIRQSFRRGQLEMFCLDLDTN